MAKTSRDGREWLAARGDKGPMSWGRAEKRTDWGGDWGAESAAVSTCTTSRYGTEYISLLPTKNHPWWAHGMAPADFFFLAFHPLPMTSLLAFENGGLTAWHT